MNDEKSIVLRVGLIGCGSMGSIHSRALKAISSCMNVKITALADSNEDLRMKESMRWPDAKLFEDGMELLENASIDLVHICLPNFLHTPYAEAAMRKNCHVFLEKPVCLTRKDGRNLLEIQKETGAAVMIGQVVRYFQEYRYLKKVYDNGSLGNLKSIIMKRIGKNPGHWFLDSDKSGSVVVDLHLHDADFVRYMLGEPESFKTWGTKFSNGTVNQVVTFYNYKNLFVQAEGMWDISETMPFEAGYRASFENATVVFDSLRDSGIKIYTKDGQIIRPELSECSLKNSNYDDSDISDIRPYYNEIKSFIRYLSGEKDCEIVSLLEGVKSLELVLAEYEQIK